MAEFNRKIEFVEYDSRREEHITHTYYEHDEVMAAISSRDHKYSILEEKYRKLAKNYNELVRMKAVENSEYWKEQYQKLIATIKSFDEERG